MKVPMKWLNDYVEQKVSTEEYARQMIMAGNAAEEIIDLSEAFSGVVVGKVIECENLEGSDHLHVCKVDVGEGDLLQIVCGAPNVRTDALVCVAKAGAILPGGHKIKEGKLRGTLSQGMLCSGPELGIEPGLYPHCGDEGLLLFGEDHAPGQDVREVFGLDAMVVDFEILANRPDCLSIWGIARESSAVLDQHCMMPVIDVREDGEGELNDYAKISIMDDEKCPRYCARVITDVKIGPSPDWMRQRLHAAGIRPINNIVDITNYVMIETGHPMHAFDLSKVRDQTIIVRGARRGEQITTLDGKQHDLTPDMLVIADAEKATGLAGIMGGEESEIVSDTRAVLFECASFDRTSTRLTARALGIRTESSGRFERGVCIPNTLDALERACMLVNDLECGKVVPGAFDHYANPSVACEIDASVSRINALISTDLSGEQMEDILLRLGMEVMLCEDELHCVVPEWRGDITQEADLAEEVLRLYGYHHIPSTLPMGVFAPGSDEGARASKLVSTIKQTLVGMGCYEALNFSFVSRKWAEMMQLDADDWRLDPVEIRNPLGEDTSVMRTMLAPSMLTSLSTNINRSNVKAKLFELSTAFKKRGAGELPEEQRVLCVGLYGDQVDFYAVKDMAMCLLQVFGIDARAERGGDGYYHPGRKAILKAGDAILGQLGEVHPDVAERFDIEDRRVYLLELSVHAISDAQIPMLSVVPLPKFPSVSRDLALVMDESTGVGPLMDQIRESAGKLIEDVQLFDIYRGTQLGEAKKSVAFSLTFRAPDRTLTEEEIGKAVSRVLKDCEEKCGARIRQ